MKKLFLLPLLLLPLLVFNACSSDDDDNGTPVSIIGTWVMSDAKGTNVQTNNKSVTEAIQADIQSAVEEGESLIFTEGNKIQMTSETKPKPKDVGTYELKGNKLTMNIGTMEIGDNRIIVATMSGNTLTYDVDQTSYYVNNIAELVPNELGVKVSKVIATLTFTKK